MRGKDHKREARRGGEGEHLDVPQRLAGIFQYFLAVPPERPRADDVRPEHRQAVHLGPVQVVEDALCSERVHRLGREHVDLYSKFEFVFSGLSAVTSLRSLRRTRSASSGSVSGYRRLLLSRAVSARTSAPCARGGAGPLEARAGKRHTVTSSCTRTERVSAVGFSAQKGTEERHTHTE